MTHPTLLQELIDAAPWIVGMVSGVVSGLLSTALWRVYEKRAKVWSDKAGARAAEREEAQLQAWALDAGVDLDWLR